jgi:hypothetical protein
MIITLVFEKNANFFVENGRKSQKIVIITSTPELLGQLTYACLCNIDSTYMFSRHESCLIWLLFYARSVT